MSDNYSRFAQFRAEQLRTFPLITEDEIRDNYDGEHYWEEEERRIADRKASKPVAKVFRLTVNLRGAGSDTEEALQELISDIPYYLDGELLLFSESGVEREVEIEVASLEELR